jgi:hypothetical protein
MGFWSVNRLWINGSSLQEWADQDNKGGDHVGSARWDVLWSGWFLQGFPGYLWEPSDESHLIGNGQRPRGPDPGLADAEIITLLRVLPRSGFKYWKNFYNGPMGEVLRRYFPEMPC